MPTKKILAALTLFTFLIQTIAFSAPELVQRPLSSQEVKLAEFTLEIPQELGQIQKIHQSTEGTGVLVHIQNAHGNYDAQQNIQGMIQHLHEKYGMRLLLLEGGDKKLNPGLFHFFNDPALNLKVADILMRHGEFTGAEMFLLADEGKKTAGYGIEKTELYRKNVDLFRQVIRGGEVSREFLKSVEGRLQVLESRIFTRDLRDFVKEWRKQQEETRADLLGYIQVLAKEAGIRLSLDLKDAVNQDAYPAVLRVLKLKDLEGQLDVKKIEEEKQALLEAVKGKADQEFYEALAGMNSTRRFDKQSNPRFVLERIHEQVKGLDFKKYPNFSKYAAYLVFQAEIESEPLFKESKELTERIFDALAKTEEEKKLLGLIKDEILLEKLFKLELSRQEYAEITGKRGDFDPEGFTNRIAGMEKEKAGKAESVPAGVREMFTEGLEFYRVAEERELHFMEKAIEAMKERKETRAVMVTGGFHAEGMEELVKAKGMSYVSVSPRIKELKGSQEIYLSAMLGTTELGGVELKEEVKRVMVEETGKSLVDTVTNYETDSDQILLFGGEEQARDDFSGRVAAALAEAASLGEQEQKPQPAQLAEPSPLPLEQGFAIQGASLGGYQINPEVTQGIVPKKSPGTEDFTNAEQIFYAALSRDLRNPKLRDPKSKRKESPVVAFPEPIKKRIQSVFAVSPEEAEELRSRKREPVTFKEQLWVLLEMGAFQFQIDDLEDQSWIVKQAYDFNRRNIKQGDPRLYPRLDQNKNPMGVMGFLSIEEVPVGPGKKEWKALIHITKGLWEELGMPADPAKEPIPDKAVHFLAQLAAHEGIEAFLGAQAGISPHRLASSMELFLASPEARARGVSDLNIWFLENGSERYFQTVQGDYTVRKDPTVGAFDSILWDIARRKGYQLTLTEPLPAWRKILGGDHAVLTAVGIEPLSEDQKSQLERDYGAKGKRKAIVPQERVAVPEEVVRWIQENKVGDTYEILLQLISAGEDQGNNRMVFVIDDNDEDLFYQLREHRGKRRPEIIAFLAQKKSESKREEGKAQGPIEIHITKATWHKMWEDWQRNHPGQDAHERPAFLAQILIQIYIQNFLPRGIEGLDPAFWAGVQSINFGTQRAKLEWVNDIQLFSLDEAANARNVRYLYNVFAQYRMMDDVQGNFRKIYFDTLYRVYDPKGDGSAEGNGFLVDAIENEMDLAIYYAFLFERVLKGAPHERLLALTPMLQAAAKKNNVLKRNLDLKSNDFIFKFRVDEKGKVLEMHETPKGKSTLVYILQGVHAFLPLFFDVGVTEHFRMEQGKAVKLAAQQAKLDQLRTEREEVNVQTAKVEAELLAGALLDAKRAALEEEKARLLARTGVLKELIDTTQKSMNLAWLGKFPQALDTEEAALLRISPEEEEQVRALEKQVQAIIARRDVLIQERKETINDLMDNSGKNRADKRSIQFETRVIDDRGAPPRLKSQSQVGTYDVDEVPAHFQTKSETYTPTVFEKAMSATAPVAGAPSGSVHPEEIRPGEEPGILELAAHYQIETGNRKIGPIAVDLARKLIDEILAAGEVTGALRDLLSNSITAERLRPALYRIFSQRDVSVISDVHATVEGARKTSEVAYNMPLVLNGDLVDRGPYLDMLLKLGDQFSGRRTLGNHDMVSLAGFLGDISSFGEWLRWQLAYGNEGLVTETYGLDLTDFKAYTDQFYGHLKDPAPGNTRGDFPKKDQLAALETKLRGQGLLEEGASVPTRLGTIYAMAALNIHLKVKGNLVGLSKIPYGQIAIDPALDAALVDRVRTQILPKVRQQNEATFKDKDLSTILSESEIEDLRAYFRLSQKEKDMVFKLMLQIAQQKKPGMEQARKMLQGAMLYDILEVHPVLAQIDEAMQKADPQWKKHPQVLLIHAGIPVTEKMELADLNGNALVIPEGGNARDTLLQYWDGLQERLNRLYEAYEEVLAGGLATLPNRLRQYLAEHAEDLKLANELAMGYYSPLYLRNGIEDVLNIYAPSSPHIRDKKYEEVDAPIQHGRRDAASLVAQQYGQLIDQLGFDAVIVGHINTKKGRIEVYANGRMFNVDVKHTEKGGPSGGKDTSTGNGAAVVVGGRSITALEIKALPDGFYTARDKLEKELMALKEEWHLALSRGEEISAELRARVEEIKAKIRVLDKILAPLDEIKALNDQINDLHRQMAEITDRPFAEWVRRESSIIKTRKAEVARGDAGSRPDQVIVAIYGPAGTGKTVATGYVRDHTAVYLEDMGIVKNRRYDLTSPSVNTRYIANPAYLSARQTPDMPVAIENPGYNPNLPEKDVNPEYVWDVVGLRINFLGSDPHLYQGDGIRYIRVTQDGRTFRYSIITGPQIYKASEIQRLLRGLSGEQETLAPDDPHAPYSPFGTTFSEDSLNGRRPIFGRELEMLLMDMTVYGLSSNLLEYVDEVVPALFTDDAKRLSRRFYRDVIPKWAGGSRGENELFILAEFARMQMREGLWYMLPMIRTIVESKGQANLWLPDTHQMAVARRKSDGAVTPLQVSAESLGADAGRFQNIIEQLETGIGGKLDQLYTDFPAEPINELAVELRDAKVMLADAVMKLEAGEIGVVKGLLRDLSVDIELLKSRFDLKDEMLPGQSEEDLIAELETVKNDLDRVLSDPILAASLGEGKKLEHEAAKAVADLLRAPLRLDADAKVTKGAYGEPGYGVPPAAAIDGSFALSGTQGYFVTGSKNEPVGRGAFLAGVENMRDFFLARKPKLVMKVGIGGQQTPFWALSDAFMALDEDAVFISAYELGENYEAVIQKILDDRGWSWDQVAVIPSSKSGTTDETMRIFEQILHAFLKHAAAAEGVSEPERLADKVFETFNGVNLPQGKELDQTENLFKGFNLPQVNEKLNAEGIAVTADQLASIFKRVFGSMFFETTDNIQKSRLAAFVHNAGMDQIVGDGVHRFSEMFDNVGGRWTGDLHMEVFLAFYGLDAGRYHAAREQGVWEVRNEKHLGNELGNFILDREITDIAFVVPDPLFGLGKLWEQNWNESLWQEGFATLVAIRQSDWEARKKDYESQPNRLVINLTNLEIQEGPFNVFPLKERVSEAMGDGFRLPGVTDVSPADRQALAETFAELFNTFYGATDTVGNVLIARALLKAGYSVEDIRSIDLGNLEDPRTKIVQENLYFRQPWVEFTKGFLTKDFTDLQQAGVQALEARYDSIKQTAATANIESQLPGVLVPQTVQDQDQYEQVLSGILNYAKQTEKRPVAFVFQSGERFREIREHLTKLGFWVIHGTADLHINFQQIANNPDKFAVLFLSFVPENPLQGLPAIGFAKGYLNGVSPHLARGVYFDNSYRALMERKGTGVKVFVSDTETNHQTLLKAADHLIGASLGQAEALRYSREAGRAVPESMVDVAHDVTLDVYNLEGATAVVVNYYRGKLGLIRENDQPRDLSEAMQAALDGEFTPEEALSQAGIARLDKKKPVLVFMNEIFEDNDKTMDPAAVAKIAKTIAADLKPGDLFVGVIDQPQNRIMAQLYKEAAHGKFRAKALPRELVSDAAIQSMTSKLNAAPVSLSSLTQAGDEGLQIQSMTRIRLNKKALERAGMSLEWAVGLLQQIEDNPEVLQSKLGLRLDSQGFFEAGSEFVQKIEQIYAELQARKQREAAA